MQNRDWLAQVQEEIIEPDLPICDPHHHLWDRNGSRYLLHELLEDVDTGHNVVSTVFVECDSMFNVDVPKHLAPVGETEFVQGVAAMSSSGQYGNCRAAAGIVSFADLTLGEGVREVLQAHVDASPNRFRGIRHAAGWHASDDIKNSHSNPIEHQLLQDDFMAGFKVLGEMGLSFDAWFYHCQMDDFVQLARANPEVNIILDHFGGPLGIGPYDGKQDEVYEAWQEGVAPLEGCTNVTFKLGGINMKVNGFGWHQRSKPATSDELVDKTARYYDYCIDTFGADRCMFESNFPVDRESVSYPVLWNAFKKMAQNRSAEEKDQLFRKTAEQVYRL
ncbi:MAG: amidohydrolase family protein [Gammaproteobacteria bacterium]|jgi:L-fuconolactonase|nr:amidohydrolase family protein [Gammaproteobacteria bacterium]MBT4492808.1 amidohydrolase family protein [Gammaproteobacteria bacterium]